MATMFFISAPIYPFIREEEETEITTAIAISGTTLVVDNTQGFSGDDYIIIGTLGKETAEIVKITSVDSNTSLTIGAVKFAHAVDDPVRRTPFNQINFYSCATETGTYALDGSAENMQVDNDDLMTGHATTTSNARTLFWKATYYNSTSGNETSQSDAEAIYGATTLYCTPQDVYDFLDLDETKLNSGTVSLVIEGATQEIESRANTLFYTGTITNEYHTGKGYFDDEYFLKHTPVIAITKIETTQNVEGTTTPTFDELTETSHYEKDLSTGRIAIVDSTYIPEKGRRNGFRASYTHGYSAIPRDIRRLAILMVCRDLALGEAYSELINSSENIKEKIAEVNERYIEETLAQYIRISIGKT